MQPGCRLVTNPKDSCCKIPDCQITPYPNGTYPSKYPKPLPAPYPSPNPAGTIVGGPPPQKRTGFCEFKGHQYQTGDSWTDGCDFNCTCTDQTTGLYACTQMCPPYPNLPAQCVLVEDPGNKCCQVPYCPSLNPVPSSTPSRSPSNPDPVSSTTVSPPNMPIPSPVPQPHVCVFMGKWYTQGQKWNVGCDKVCVCEDGQTGTYSCTDRCPQYPAVYSK